MKIVIFEITDAPVITGKSGTNERGAWSIPDKQVAFIHMGEKYPVRTEVPVPAGQSPYRPGSYLLAGPCIAVGDYSRMRMDDRAIELVPVAEAVELLKGEAKLKAA